MLERFTWFRQSAYQWRGDGITVYIDPWDVTTEEEADLVLVTHAHFDHFQPEEIARISGERTKVVAPHDVAEEISGDVTAVRPGDSIEVAGVSIQAVPAYNIVPDRLENHPKDKEWVGYLLTLGDHTYYHAGDTDHLPELEQLRTDVAFVPIGGTYTMDATEAAGLVKAMGPKIAVPMHYGFVVGRPSDADRFRTEADPVTVQTLEPVHPFEQL